jgi:hypothetical protein
VDRSEDLENLLPGYDRIEEALEARPDIRLLLRHLGTIEESLRRPASPGRANKLAMELGAVLTSLLLVEELLWERVGSAAPWRTYRWLGQGAGWVQAASIAQDYALHHATTPAEAFEALRSAIAHAGEATLSYLRLELCLPAEESKPEKNFHCVEE